jgi:hypothetical protein
MHQIAAWRGDKSRNDRGRDALGGRLDGQQSGASRGAFSKEMTMRNKLFAIAALAGALGAPLAAQAQSEMTVGVGRAPVIVNEVDAEGITVERRPAFREYVVRERVPTYTVPDRVVVGATLPDAGVTYYDVPQTYGSTPYRYTVVNGQTVLVEPRSRRIVQVID